MADMPKTDDAIAAALRGISTATATTIMFKKGIRRVAIRGAAPLGQGQGRVAGKAFTMRFVPAREDLSNPSAWSNPVSTRKAVEEVPAGAFVVIDAMGCHDSGVFGDILCARLHVRGAVGAVTDGAMRDLAGIREAGLPVWAGGGSAPPAASALTFVGWQEPVACGTVAVFPGEWILADDDGAIVIPAACLEDVLKAGAEQEALEQWIVQQVAEGHSLDGLYPPSEATLQRYRSETGQ